MSGLATWWYQPTEAAQLLAGAATTTINVDVAGAITWTGATGITLIVSAPSLFLPVTMAPRREDPYRYVEVRT